MTTIAIIGCAHIHTPGFIGMIKKRTDVKVKSVWDHHEARGRQRAAELGAAFVADEKQAFADPDVQAVVICSETDRHAALVAGATAARKHLFVEKPLGAGAADAYAMADAIERAGVIFQTGYFQRGDGKILFLKQQVDRGAFGKVTRVRGANCHSGALGGWFDAKPNDPANDWRWMANPKVSGVGAFGDLGTHSLDILLWLFGKVDAVTAQVDVGTNRYDGCDEAGEGLIRFECGVIATLAASWDDTASPVSYQINGTEGHAAVIGGRLEFATKRDAGFDGSHPVRNAELPASLPHAFELFLDAVGGKQGVPLVGPREAAYRSSVMEAMYTAARTNTWVRPK